VDARRSLGREEGTSVACSIFGVLFVFLHFNVPHVLDEKIVVQANLFFPGDAPN
jgi:hypothetical protein